MLSHQLKAYLTLILGVGPSFMKTSYQSQVLEAQIGEHVNRNVFYWRDSELAEMFQDYEIEIDIPNIEVNL